MVGVKMIDQFASESDQWIDKISKCATFDERLISLEHMSKEEIIILFKKSMEEKHRDPIVVLGYVLGCAMEKAYRDGNVKKHIENGKVLYSPATQLS
jgi:hypothetical protein